MRTFILALVVAACAAAVGHAQSAVRDRLPPDRLDVVSPSVRVLGTPGNLTIRQAPCRTLPMDGVRRRIIDLAVQEWGFFGFTVVDQTAVEISTDQRSSQRRRRPRLSPSESARVAGSIAGYWTVTPEGGWILDAQNEIWQGPGGLAARWRYPWSAAFISWVMCEGGLGDTSQFRRAVAHHAYIDQAIRARDAGAVRAAFTAYDIGDASIVPGDLLCSARRPAYRSIAERRLQMGDGARTHCDIVVKLDAPRSRILAVGGNVRGAVSLKLLRAARAPGQYLRPVDGALFAHLKLRAEPIEQDALDRSPTMRALACDFGLQVIDRLAAANVAALADSPSRC
jgi:hypothetical protein